MSKNEIEILGKSCVFDGYFRIDRYRLRHTLHQGGMSREIVREVFERGNAVGILPFDPDRDELVMIEQFRIGAYAAGADPWLTEIVAGIIEQGEFAEQVARREIAEETGLKVGDLWPMVRYLSSPGGASERVELFLGRVDARGAGGVHGLEFEEEDIRVFPLPYADAAAMVEEGKIGNAMTLIALQWLMLHRHEVMRAWRADRSSHP
ncbi:MAG: ADP-ribose diphosphatase [Alphaproteobacteria bacterium]|nr:ADP-ribose diphosphatase [Alphaproteobacteria bacterium]